MFLNVFFYPIAKHTRILAEKYSVKAKVCILDGTL